MRYDFHTAPNAISLVGACVAPRAAAVNRPESPLHCTCNTYQVTVSAFQVLTVNGARVLDDVVPAASVTTDDGSSADDGGSVGPMQQRRDMVLSSSGDAGGLGGTGENQQIMAIAHAVDRVLFPLPVGDVLATMRADRQRRYSVFLRAVDEHCSSSVRSMLTGKYL